MNDNQLLTLSQFGQLNTQVSLTTLTSVRVGGIVDAVLYPKDNIALMMTLKYCHKESIPTFIIGNGSNLLASDEPYHGLIIKLTRTFNHIYKDGETLIVEAGYSLPSLASYARKEGLSGLEWAGGIPGTVGGALFMNAGAYRSSMSDLVTKILVFADGQCHWMNKEDCDYSYRHSIFQSHKEWIILACMMTLTKGDSEQIEAVMNERRERRLASQPLSEYSFGSCFRNPDLPSWQYIDEAGMRGYQVGSAQVSNLHSNFIVNLGSASFADMLAVIETIQDQVYEKFDIKLETEVEFFNWNQPIKHR